MNSDDATQLRTKLEEHKGRYPSDSFRLVDQKLVHQGAVISFYNLEIADADDKRFFRDVVRHPGAVSIVPFDGSNVTLVRQYRSSIDAEIFEIPAGRRDVGGEPPEITAARELAEEVGLEAGNIELLTSLHHSPGFCDEYDYIFLATDLRQVPQRLEGPEEEAMTVMSVPLDDAIAMCFDGRMTDSKSLVGVLALANRQRGSAS